MVICNNMIIILNPPETLWLGNDGCHLTGIGCRPTCNLAFIYITVFLSQTSLTKTWNWSVIPFVSPGLFVSIIISISIQSRQTVSVSGRTRPFLSSFVHIQKLRMEMKYCNFVIEQNWTGPVAQTQPLNKVCTFKITGLWMLLKPAIALPQTGAVFQRSHETVFYCPDSFPCCLCFSLKGYRWQSWVRGICWTFFCIC